MINEKKMAQHCSNCDKIIGTNRPNKSNLCYNCIQKRRRKKWNSQ